MKIKGSVLRELRKQHNLSQEKLAELIGVSSKNISFWERELNDIHDKTVLNSLANYFNVPVSMFTETLENIEHISSITLSREELYQKENILLEKLLLSFEQYAKERSTSNNKNTQTKQEW